MAIVWDCRFEHWLWRLSPKHVEGPIERERSRQRMKARGLRCEYETMGVRVSTTFEQRVIVRKSVCVWEREEDKDTKKLFRVYLWEGREREREREGKSTFTQWEREGTYAHSLSLSLSHSRELLLTLFVWRKGCEQTTIGILRKAERRRIWELLALSLRVKNNEFN